MAYTQAVLKQKDAPKPDGRVRFVYTLISDGTPGEAPTQDVDFDMDENTTVAWVRRFLWEARQKYSLRKTIADSFTVTGTPFAVTEVLPPPKTAKQNWLELASRVRAAKTLGLTDQTAVDDLAAMVTQLNNDYQTGYF